MKEFLGKLNLVRILEISTLASISSSIGSIASVFLSGQAHVSGAFKSAIWTPVIVFALVFFGLSIAWLINYLKKA